MNKMRMCSVCLEINKIYHRLQGIAIGGCGAKKKSKNIGKKKLHTNAAFFLFRLTSYRVYPWL